VNLNYDLVECVDFLIYRIAFHPLGTPLMSESALTKQVLQLFGRAIKDLQQATIVSTVEEPSSNRSLFLFPYSVFGVTMLLVKLSETRDPLK